MQKCMDGVNQDCIAANTGEEWKCFMAQVRVSNTQYMWLITDLQYTYPHIKTPIFCLMSAMTLGNWTTSCNFTVVHQTVVKMQFDNFGEVS